MQVLALKPYFQLVRLGNTLVVASGVGLGYLCVPLPLPWPALFLGMVSFMLFTMAGNIQNDLADREIDHIAHPGRPLITRSISLSQARLLTLIFYALGLCLMTASRDGGFYLGLLITAMLSYYNFSLKKKVLWGNLVVAVLCSLPIYFAEYPAPINHTLIPCLFAFCTTLAREIVKDLEDLSGDFQNGLKTLPIVHGPEVAEKLVRGALWIVLILLPLPVVFSLYNMGYALILLVGLPYPFLQAWREMRVESINYTGVQKKIKWIMLTGLVALAVGQL